MTEQENKAIITLALMAAFADGGNSDVERAEVKRIADGLSKDGNINVAAIYQDAILNRVTLATAVNALMTPAAKSLAFELCVSVCDADGPQGATEREFLASLRAALQLDPVASANASSFATNSAALAAAPLSFSSPLESPMHARILLHRNAVRQVPRTVAKPLPSLQDAHSPAWECRSASAAHTPRDPCLTPRCRGKESTGEKEIKSH